ncbi:MAG: hypothetical protein IPH15_13770 [Comamonadaceae bacterium]|nr:hypothetical protein [Comamonadaceae bacterium]
MRKIFPAVAMFKIEFGGQISTRRMDRSASDDDVYYPESFEIIERCLAKYTDMDMIVFDITRLTPIMLF